MLFPVLKNNRFITFSYFLKYFISSKFEFREAFHYQTSIQYICYPVLLHFFERKQERILSIMAETKSKSLSSSVFQKIEKNAELAENLISEICGKIIEIETMRANQQRPQNTEITQLREENERLQCEIEKWRELLALRQIRNGRKYIRVPDTRAKIKSEVTDQQPNNIIPDIVKSTNVSIITNQINNDVKSELPVTKKVENTTEPKTSSEDPAGKSSKPTKMKPKQEGKKVVAVKKEKEEGGQGQNSSTTTEVIDISRLDFRVGLITQCERHPDAESLYLEKIDVGEPNLRTVVSGLVKHIPLEAMQNRLVIVLCNLKPAKMRGITSEAMVMCASTPEKVELLIPPPGVVPGDIVDFEGFTRNPDPIMNPKKKIFETVAPDLKTNNEKVATYKGIPFSVKGKGVVTTETLLGVNIK